MDEQPTETGVWEIEGPLLARDADVWVVDAVPIVVPDEVTGIRVPTPGAMVIASGRRDAAGRRIAESVEFESGTPPESTLPAVTLSGTIEHINGDRWVIDGRELLVTDSIMPRSNESGSIAVSSIQPGNIAHIAGYELRDGRIVAIEIVLDALSDPAMQAAVDQPATSSTESDQSQPGASPAENIPSDTGDSVADDEEGADSTQDEPIEQDGEGKPKKEKPAKPDKPDKGKGHGEKDKR